MTGAYVPQVGTIAARALAHVQTLLPGAEIANSVLADALGLNPNTMSVCLDTAAKRGVLAREKREGRLYWRLGVRAPAPEKPPAEDETADAVPDLAVKQVRVDASAVPTPIAGLTRQSWCPAAQNSLPESSLDEPPAPPRPSPAPSLGLGWKPPRVPVYIGEPPAPAEVLAAAPEPGPGAALSTHGCLSTPTDDPDFQEVRRAPAPPEPDNPPKGAEAAQAPVTPCGRDDATPNDGVVPPDQFRCALWSTGLLEIVATSGDRLQLEPDDARQLVRYVSDVLSSRARASA